MNYILLIEKSMTQMDTQHLKKPLKSIICLTVFQVSFLRDDLGEGSTVTWRTGELLFHSRTELPVLHQVLNVLPES